MIVSQVVINLLLYSYAETLQVVHWYSAIMICVDITFWNDLKILSDELIYRPDPATFSPFSLVKFRGTQQTVSG